MKSNSRVSALITAFSGNQLSTFGNQHLGRQDIAQPPDPYWLFRNDQYLLNLPPFESFEEEQVFENLRFRPCDFYCSRMNVNLYIVKSQDLALTSSGQKLLPGEADCLSLFALFAVPDRGIRIVCLRWAHLLVTHHLNPQSVFGNAEISATQEGLRRPIEV